MTLPSSGRKPRPARNVARIPSGCAGPPADNGDAVRLLGDHAVLTTDLATSIRKAVGFRNVLVHGYVEVDDSIVVGRLGSLSDLDEFVRQVAGYVAGE